MKIDSHTSSTYCHSTLESELEALYIIPPQSVVFETLSSGVTHFLAELFVTRVKCVVKCNQGRIKVGRVGIA